jgi:hypothetical protein
LDVRASEIGCPGFRDKNHWTLRVKGIGSGYWRVVGELDELIDKAKDMSQRTLFGIGFATLLKNS